MGSGKRSIDERTLDRVAERLFAPNTASSSDDPGLRALTRFVEDLREAYASAPDAATRAAHIQAAVEAYRDAGVFSNGHHRNGSKAVRRARPRGLVFRGGVAAGALVLAGGSAMAAAGTLPDVAQDAVSRVAKTIGISIPKGNAPEKGPVETDTGRDVRVTRAKSRSADGKDQKAKVVDVDVADDDDDEADASDRSGANSISGGSRRPGKDSPSRPAQPARPDSDDTDSDDDDDGTPIGGGGRGDPSGGGSIGGNEPSDDDPSDDEDDGGGRGDPLDGSSSDDDGDADDASDDTSDDISDDTSDDTSDDDGGID